MRALFSIARAARLANLSLEATNEAARVLALKVVVADEDVPISITFKALSILRDIAPALRRGVTADVAYADFCATARERIAGGRDCVVTQLRPTIPNTDEALRYIDQANELFEKPTSIRYERELNLASAEHLLRRSIALDPKIALAWGDLATVLWERSVKRTTCAQLYRRALALDPDMVDALYAVGALELQECRPEEAEALLSHASRVAPQEPRVWELLARVYSTLGRLEDARQAQEKADKLEEPRGKAALG